MEVKELRKITGLSQTAFAEKFCIKIDTYRMWEQGVNNCPRHTLFMIKRILELEGYELPKGD